MTPDRRATDHGGVIAEGIDALKVQGEERASASADLAAKTESVEERVTQLAETTRLVEERVTQLHDQVAFNTDLLARVVKNTTDIVEVWQSVRGGMKVLSWLGVFAKWLAPIVVVVTGAIATVASLLHWNAPK